jgi:hypothetical protein
MPFNVLAVFFYRQFVQFGAGALDEALAYYRETVSTERRTAATFERTRAALLAPQNELNRPYQVGYKWVRAILSSVNESCAEAREDPDVALNFLCSYFFDDLRLAELMADCSWSFDASAVRPKHSIKDVGEYIASRVASLHSPSVASMYQEFERALTKGEIRGCSRLNFSVKRYRRIEELAAQAAANELPWPAPKSSRYRGVFRVAVMSGDSLTIRVKQSRFEMSVDGIQISGPVLSEGLPAGEQADIITDAPDAIAVELILVRHQFLLCVFYKGSLIAALDRNSQPLPTEIAERLLGDLSPFTHAEWWRRHYWELVNRDANSTCGDFLADHLKQASECANLIYVV